MSQDNVRALRAFLEAIQDIPAFVDAAANGDDKTRRVKRRGFEEPRSGRDEVLTQQSAPRGGALAGLEP
jgi:hypothetical protein